MLETRIGVKCSYKCSACDYLYSEQRAKEENPYFTKCAICKADYELIAEEEYTYEVEVPDAETV